MALKDVKKEDSLKTPEPEEQQNIGFPRFSFCLIYPRFGAREAEHRRINGCILEKPYKKLPLSSQMTIKRAS